MPTGHHDDPACMTGGAPLSWITCIPSNGAKMRAIASTLAGRRRRQGDPNEPCLPSRMERGAARRAGRFGTDVVACRGAGTRIGGIAAPSDLVDGVGGAGTWHRRIGDRPGVGGAGNGQGGGTNWLNGTVFTRQYGAAPSNGAGGAGAEGFRDGS